MRTLGASRRTASLLPVMCCLMNAASARSAWARTARVIPGGTRWRTVTVASWWRAMASAKWSASSACGPPRTGTRTRRISFEPRCLTTAMSHGDSRTTSSMVGEKTVGPLRVAAAGGPTAPAEDDEVGLLLGGRFDDPLGRVPADAHDRVDRRPVRGVVEHPLEEPPGVPGARRALGQRHALGHLDDPERRQLARPPVEHRGAEPDELLGGHRVGDRDEDPARGAAPSAAISRSPRSSGRRDMA